MSAVWAVLHCLGFPIGMLHKQMNSRVAFLIMQCWGSVRAKILRWSDRSVSQSVTGQPDFAALPLPAASESAASVSFLGSPVISSKTFVVCGSRLPWNEIKGQKPINGWRGRWPTPGYYYGLISFFMPRQPSTTNYSCLTIREYPSWPSWCSHSRQSSP